MATLEANSVTCQQDELGIKTQDKLLIAQVECAALSMSSAWQSNAALEACHSLSCCWPVLDLQQLSRADDGLYHM